MLTIKDLSVWLNIKPSTLYLWASQGKIPCRRIHGLIRFEPEVIQAWLNTFGVAIGKPLMFPIRHDSRELDHLIEAAKREVYTPRHGETFSQASSGRGIQMGLFRRNKVWWMTFIHQGQQIRRSTGTTDRRLADAILGKVRVKIVEGRFFDTLEAKDHTFNEMMDRYLIERSITKAPASRLRDEQCLVHLRHALGPLSLAEVTPKLLAAYKTQRREKAKPATVNKELGLVRHSFNVAIREWEWCRDNPMQKVRMEKVRNERDRWLSSDEEGRLLAHSAPWLQDIIVFALNTGMRRGEILNLQWQAIDLNRQVLVVMRSKNGEKRTVPLNGRLTELLQRKASKKTTGSFVFARAC